jgi:hypothetical protein
MAPQLVRLVLGSTQNSSVPVVSVQRTSMVGQVTWQRPLMQSLPTHVSPAWLPWQSAVAPQYAKSVSGLMQLPPHHTRPGPHPPLPLLPPVPELPPVDVVHGPETLSPECAQDVEEVKTLDGADSPDATCPELPPPTRATHVPSTQSCKRVQSCALLQEVLVEGLGQPHASSAITVPMR